MTAYGAVISLKITIKHIADSSHVSLADPSLDLIQLAYTELQPLKEILERLDSTSKSKSKSRKKVNALDRRIKDLIWEFEDLLESHILSQQIRSQLPAHQVDEEMKKRECEIQPLLESPSQQVQFQSQSPAPDHGRRRVVHKSKGEARRRLKSTKKSNTRRIMNESQSSHSRSLEDDVAGERFSIDLLCLQDDVRSFVHTLKEMEKEYIYELENMAEDDEDESISSTTESGYGGTNSKMIGLSDQFQQLKYFLLRRYPAKYVYALVAGMAGVGKTTLAKKIYEDPQISSYFECRAWVRVGRKSHFDEVSRSILAQLCGDEKLGDSLEGKKCLIVVDDVWEEQLLISLIKCLPRIGNGSIQILVTAREGDVIKESALFEIRKLDLSILVRFLNEEESKELLCEKVFGEESCPPQLDKAATEIAKKCEGLPLMIVAVVDFLSKSQNREPEYWDDVAEERNSVFRDAYNEISKVLFPSYDYLPQSLKMPFLFMGVFPKDYDTPPSKIMNMLTAEGWFLHTYTKELFEESVWRCLGGLCTDKNLVLFNKKSSSCNEELRHYKFKTCRLHSSWRHVCRGEARRNKFYLVLNRLVDAEEEGVKGQRGLCLENNILFGIKEFHSSVRLSCASSTRSLLFYGPYHQYPIPIDVGFRLLREIDALTQRFYTFPIEILPLVQLKYLALTCNGELPTTISKLFNLRVLIIHPHMSIKRVDDPSYVPIQIWDMQELEHIEILGKNLVAPHHEASLEKLTTLVGVNASTCTIFELFKKVPSVRKLGVQIQLTPSDDQNDLLSCFGCISKHHRLDTLKCSIMNPVVKYAYVVPASPVQLMFPSGLNKLHLSGMGFPWEYMDVIGSLPFLKVLKLRSYAFRGSEWEAQEDSFVCLKFLLIEDSDLVQWKPGTRSFPNLTYLSMKHCYKLEEIHWLSSNSVKIELVDCNPLALTWAKQLQPSPHTVLDVTIASSFEKKPMAMKLQRYGRTWTKYKSRKGQTPRSPSPCL